LTDDEINELLATKYKYDYLNQKREVAFEQQIQKLKEIMTKAREHIHMPSMQMLKLLQAYEPDHDNSELIRLIHRVNHANRTSLNSRILLMFDATQSMDHLHGRLRQSIIKAVQVICKLMINSGMDMS